MLASLRLVSVRFGRQSPQRRPSGLTRRCRAQEAAAAAGRPFMAAPTASAIFARVAFRPL